jgi:hypothetical protein
MTDEASKSPHADAGRLERPVGRLEPERASACGLTECHGKPMCTRCLHIDHRDKAPWPDMPKEPPLGLLMSMAIRFDHGLGVPGYYDSEWFRRPGQPSHKQRVEATLTMMRQLYEEVSGHGFYSTAKEAEYAALADSRPPNVRAKPPANGGSA